jgi:hypothetical protein
MMSDGFKIKNEFRGSFICNKRNEHIIHRVALNIKDVVSNTVLGLYFRIEHFNNSSINETHIKNVWKELLK